jgi:two-component system OmpR family response regulator
MFLATDRVLQVGSTIRLELELPNLGGERVVRCRVVYVRDRQAAERSGKPEGMGLQFLDLDEEALSQIGRFIAEKSVEALESASEQRRASLSVLVVDDDHASREAAAKPFRDRGDVVRTASDGVDALAACLADPPDVILSDVQMPRMDGWQLVRIIRARSALVRVPMLFLTRLRGEDERLKGYQLGVDDFVPKPSRPEELLARVDRVVARTRQPMRTPAAEKTQKTLRGDLEQVSMASVLSFLELERKTGILSLAQDGRNAAVHIEQGQPRQAFLDGAKPEQSARQRLTQLLDWDHGQFEFAQAAVACADEIRSSLTSLLLDHARENDEEAR